MNTKTYTVTYTFEVEATTRERAYGIAGKTLRDPEAYDSDNLEVEEAE